MRVRLAILSERNEADVAAELEISIPRVRRLASRANKISAAVTQAQPIRGVGSDPPRCTICRRFLKADARTCAVCGVIRSEPRRCVVCGRFLRLDARKDARYCFTPSTCRSKAWRRSQRVAPTPAATGALGSSTSRTSAADRR